MSKVSTSLTDNFKLKGNTAFPKKLSSRSNFFLKLCAAPNTVCSFSSSCLALILAFQTIADIISVVDIYSGSEVTLCFVYSTLKGDKLALLTKNCIFMSPTKNISVGAIDLFRANSRKASTSFLLS